MPMASSKRNRSYHEVSIRDVDDKYNKGSKKPFPWFRLAATLILMIGCFFLINWFQHGENPTSQVLHDKASLNQVTPSQKPVEESEKDETSKTYFWNNLPSSDVWCRGEKRFDRICRIRNLCYHPTHKKWFIVKTSKSVIQNVPFNETEFLFIELNTVEGHNKFFWSYSEVSPFNPKFQNINMRYETSPHFMFSRLHPNNIMHNLHDDVLGLFFTIKEFGAASGNSLSFDFKHRILIMDDYGPTKSGRPFQYFTDHPLKFFKDIAEDNTITCFKDAVLGNNKIAAFYQYGFFVPQSKIQNKDLNGMYIREVASLIYNRVGIKNSFDENELNVPTKMPKSELFGTENSALDLKETNLIIIFIRKGNRLIINEKELADGLKKKYKLEVQLVSNEENSFEEQVKYMRRARVVIGMHGSIMFMTMFCRRGTVVVELFPFAVPSKNYTPYKTLAELRGMELVYRAWENKHEDANIGHPENPAGLGGIIHLAKEEQEKILSTKTVPEHLCCTSPYWLYRIYQDTSINIQEVLDIIDDGLKFSRENILKGLYSANYFEASFIKPATITTAKCNNDSPRRLPDQLYISWDYPWNGAQVSMFSIQCNGKEYLTLGNKTSIVISNLQPNTTYDIFSLIKRVKFAIRTWAPGYKGFWGPFIYCNI